MNNNSMEFMDIDGPEYIADVNNQIANFRASHYQLANANVYLDQNDIHMTLQIPVDAFSEIAILDTNFLLSKLGYLDALLNLANENPGNLLVILPWIVIRELDGLKGHNSEVSSSARKAMKFIELRLRDKIVSLRGQKMTEILNKDMLHKQNIKGDDRILDCCMYFYSITQKRVCLLSNDRNLCIKAMVHDIDSISAESKPKMEALLNRVVSQDLTYLKYNHHQTNDKVNIPKSRNEMIILGECAMEIDDSIQYNAHKNGNPGEDYMMIDDDVAFEKSSKKQPSQHIIGGTESSRWAKSSSFSRQDYATPSYLNDDPNLTAPKRPFRPEHNSYSWAKKDYNQE